jgi:hypothetical protein
MEVLGHAQMRTTTDTDSHVMPALGRDAADRMGNALWDRCGTARGPVATKLAPQKPKAASLEGKRPGEEGEELRGLEPLTRTLPGQLDRVRTGSPKFSIPPDLGGE